MECYKEEGSTTTPFDMMLRNCVSRYHIMEAAIRGGAKHNPKVALDMTSLLAETRHQITKVQQYIYETGKDKYINFLRDNRYMGLYYADYQLDPEGTFDIPKFEGTVFEKGSTDKGESGSKEDGFFVN